MDKVSMNVELRWTIMDYLTGINKVGVILLRKPARYRHHSPQTRVCKLDVTQLDLQRQNCLIRFALSSDMHATNGPQVSWNDCRMAHVFEYRCAH
jgi:hypothetical protein